MLVKTACCFANGSSGRAFVVFGIADRTPGPDAFNGTERDPTEIEHLIFAATRPHLTVDAWAAYAHGTRIVVIRVPAGLAVHTGIDEVVRHRVGDACLPLEGSARSALEEARAIRRHRRRTAVPWRPTMPKHWRKDTACWTLRGPTAPCRRATARRRTSGTVVLAVAPADGQVPVAVAAVPTRPAATSTC